MKQSLHIFLKDARHLWIEILISVILTVALIPLYPGTANFSFGARDIGFSASAFVGGSLSFLAGLLIILIPIGWWILISRVIHAERLVGDRQFWLTRPYQWKSLLAAKVLFLIAFVYLPLFITQCILLIRAGFSPAPHIPGLFFSALLMTGALILPVAALASVTSTLVRVMLTVLGVLLYLVTLMSLANTVTATHLQGVQGVEIPTWLTVCVCIFVILNQYATRRTSLSLVALAALLLFIAAITFAAPNQSFVTRDYPPLAAGEAPLVQLTYNTSDPVRQSTAYVTARNDEVGIALPILESGVRADGSSSVGSQSAVPEGAIVIPQAIRATIDAPGGTHWQSVWLPMQWGMIEPGERLFPATFNMPRALYDRLRSTPVNINLEITFKQARQNTTTTIDLSNSDFAIPNYGICSPLIGIDSPPGEIQNVVCRAPLHQPALTRIETTLFAVPCAEAAGQPGVQSAAWSGSLDQGGSFFIVPIWSSAVGFSNRFIFQPRQAFRHICVGTPITFTRYVLTRQAQQTLSIQNFRLPALTQGQVRIMQDPQ